MTRKRVMHVESPGEGRAIIEHGPQDMTITTPAKCSGGLLVFLVFWLCGWAVGEFLVLWGAVTWLFGWSGDEAAPVSTLVVLFMAAWLMLWTIGGIAALAALLWMLTGSEIVRVSSAGIEVLRYTLIWKRHRSYDARHIARLRLRPPRGRFDNDDTDSRNSASGMLNGFSDGSIKFDYGRKTVGFGLELDDADARHVAGEITQRYPGFA